MPTTIVIGMGISAVAYLRSIDRRPLGTTTVLGGPDLWNRLDPHHAMGQPRQLLTGNLLGNRPTDRNFSTRPTPGTFLSAGIFADAMDSHMRETGAVTAPGSFVKSITKSGRVYTVHFAWLGFNWHVPCDNVIIATGPGVERPLKGGDDGKLDINVPGFGGRVVNGNDFMSPTWKMPGDTPMKDAIIAVYGGSATAAWVVELAEMRGLYVDLWFTRAADGPKGWDPISRFEAAFPAGGRNSRIQENYLGRRMVLKLTNVEDRNAGKSILLSFKNEQNVALEMPAALLVYALGAEHTVTTGVGAMLDPTLRSAMIPYYDRNYALSGTPSILAVGTPDGSLMIVGAAMSSVAGFGKHPGMMEYRDPQDKIKTLQPYSKIADSLPSAARPAEGIAMVMAGVEALNSYMPAWSRGVNASYYTPDRTTAPQSRMPDGRPTGLPRGSVNPYSGRRTTHETSFEWDINFNTSNRTQLAAYIAQTTDLSPLAANIAVSLLVRLRTMKANALGLGLDQVNTIVRSAEAYAAEIVRLNPDLETKRRYWEKQLGIDGHLDVMVDHFVKNDGWREYWRTRGIACDVPTR